VSYWIIIDQLIREGIMPKFNVTVKERCVRHAIEEIEADDWEQAENIAKKMYFACKLDFEYATDEVYYEAEEIENA
jgi:hypothetical protein